MNDRPPNNEELDAIDRELRGLADDETASTRTRMPSELQEQLDAVLVARREILADTGGTQVVPESTTCASGQRIGPFELQERVGRGAQGEVWRATDSRHGRVVALKLVPRSRDDADVATRRFEREAELARRLDHPSLCAVYDAGRLDDHLFLAMRFVDGPSLAELRPTRERRPGPARIREALELCAQLADGLAAAHAVGILHRDVKPGNVRIDHHGVPVLVDFGLARDEQAGVSLTGDATIGTPAYMPPEALVQQRGRRQGHDARSDIWSLGVVLFELVTGERPFEAATREGLYRAITCDAATNARRSNPNVSREAATVIATCLEKDPDQRYGDASALATDLRRLTAGERPLARTPGPILRMLRWVQQNPLPAAIGLLLVLLLGSSLALLDRAIDAERGAHEALTNERSARRASDGMRLIANARTLADRQPGLALSLALLGTERCPDASADDALFHALQQPWDERIWDLGAGTVHAIAFSPEGRWLACACDDGSTHLLNMATAKRLLLPGQGSTRRCLSFLAPDQVAVGDDDGTVFVWRFIEDAVGYYTVGDHPVTAIATVPGGFVAGDAAGQIHRFAHSAAGQGWQLDRSWQGHSEAITSLTFRGGTLASSGNDGRAVIWRTAANKPQRTFTHPMPELGGATLSRDGSTLFCASTDNRLWSWNADTGERRFIATGHRSGLFSVAAHPSGPFAVTTSFDRTAILWHADHGRIVRRFGGHRRSVVDARFSPDGSLLATASADGTVRLWSTHAPMEAQRLQAAGRMTSAQFSANGEELIVSGDRGAAGIWNLRDGQRRHSFGSDRPARAIWACPSPDTKTVYSMDNRGRLHAYDRATATTRHCADVPTRVVDMRYTLLCSPGSDQVLIAAASGRAWLYDTVALRPDQPGRLPEPLAIRGLANFYNVGRTPRAGFLRDGRRLVTVIESDDHSFVVLWDRRSGKELARHDAGQGFVFSVAMHPLRNRILLGCSRGTAEELDLDTGERRTLFETDPFVTSARYDHRGEGVVAADQQGGIWLWHDGTEVRRLQGHESVVYDVSFSPDDQTVLSTSWDGSAALWNAKSGARLRIVGSRAVPMFDASFAPTGDYLVTVSDHGFAHTWPLDPLAFVRAHHRREITAEERARLQIDTAKAQSSGH